MQDWRQHARVENVDGDFGAEPTRWQHRNGFGGVHVVVVVVVVVVDGDVDDRTARARVVVVVVVVVVDDVDDD